MSVYRIYEEITGEEVATIDFPSGEPQFCIELADGYDYEVVDVKDELIIEPPYFKTDLTQKVIEEVFNGDCPVKNPGDKCDTNSRYTAEDGITPLIPYNLVVSRTENTFSNYRSGIPDGKFVALTDNLGTTIMSNTPMEKFTNKEFLQRAKGNVLIAGLGIGLLTQELKNLPEGRISKITVVEKSEELLDFYNRIHYNSIFDNIRVYNEDIRNFIPSETYDTIYFDIWDNLSYDTLEEGDNLCNHFMPYLNAGGYMSYWGKYVNDKYGLYSFFQDPDLWRDFK